MPKPPTESFVLLITRRMLAVLFVLVVAVLIPTVGAQLAREIFPSLTAQGAGIPVPLPVPELGYTPGGGRPDVYQVSGVMPEPGPNQKRAGACDPERSEVAIRGGCWVKTETPPPCPSGKQWEYEGRCWLPVAPAARMPSSGGSLPVTIAE